MQLDELLVARGMLQPADLERAAARRRERGGKLVDNLLALRLISLEQLDAVLRMTPPAAPSTIEESGVGERNLLRLLVTAMYVGGDNTAPKLAETLKLPSGIVLNLLQIAMDRKLAEIVGTEAGTTLRVVIYALTEQGRTWAIECQEQTKYLGPAPVPLDAYCDQIKRQRIGSERVDRVQIQKAFGDLVLTENFITKLGPAINSGRSILLYGPPGNGKSSVSEKIGRIFSDIIHIPYCVDADGQIIRIFDPSIHEPVASPATTHDIGIRREDFDARWVPCRRLRPKRTASSDVAKEESANEMAFLKQVVSSVQTSRLPALRAFVERMYSKPVDKEHLERIVKSDRSTPGTATSALVRSTGRAASVIGIVAERTR